MHIGVYTHKTQGDGAAKQVMKCMIQDPTQARGAQTGRATNARSVHNTRPRSSTALLYTEIDKQNKTPTVSYNPMADNGDHHSHDAAEAQSCHRPPVTQNPPPQQTKKTLKMYFELVHSSPPSDPPHPPHAHLSIAMSMTAWQCPRQFSQASN